MVERRLRLDLAMTGARPPSPAIARLAVRTSSAVRTNDSPT